MTAKMIRYDDDYAPLIDELIAKSNGHIEIIDDANLKFDPYFYERKLRLEETIKNIDNGSSKMLSSEEFWVDVIR